MYFICKIYIVRDLLSKKGRKEGYKKGRLYKRDLEYHTDYIYFYLSRTEDSVPNVDLHNSS